MNTRKIVSLILAVLMLSASLTICAGAASTTVNSVTYQLDDTTLTAKVTAVASNVASIVIPATVSYSSASYKITEIAANVGKGSTALTSLDLSGASNLEKIGSGAFSYCSALTTAGFPYNSKVTEIGSNAFYNSASLKTVTNDTRQTVISKIGSGVFSLTPYRAANKADLVKFGNVLLEYNGSTVKLIDDFALSKSGITVIADAFVGHKLTEIDLTGIKYIGGNAFYNCTQLASVTLPDCVGIGDMAFSGCTALTKVAYSDKLRNIGFCAFSNCAALSEFSCTATSGIEKIDSFAFWNCSSLNTMNLGKAVSLGVGVFTGTPAGTAVVLPSTLLKVGTGSYKNLPFDFSTLAGVKNMVSLLAKKIAPASAGATEDQKLYADFNGDGKIDLLDLYTAMKSIKKAKATLG